MNCQQFFCRLDEKPFGGTLFGASCSRKEYQTVVKVQVFAEESI